MKPLFTIRVYGICIRNGNVLLSHETHGKHVMLKFPGGGLEYGEGTLDCLQREMKEEYGLDAEVISHFYTTDFFVQSAFHEQTQVMSIYYLMDIQQEEVPEHKVFHVGDSLQYVYWQSIKELDPQKITFPIDQAVARLVMEKFSA